MLVSSVMLMLPYAQCFFTILMPTWFALHNHTTTVCLMLHGYDVRYNYNMITVSYATGDATYSTAYGMHSTFY
jgi:hypothetical protein